MRSQDDSRWSTSKEIEIIFHRSIILVGALRESNGLLVQRQAVRIQHIKNLMRQKNSTLKWMQAVHNQRSRHETNAVTIYKHPLFELTCDQCKFFRLRE